MLKTELSKNQSKLQRTKVTKAVHRTMLNGYTATVHCFPPNFCGFRVRHSFCSQPCCFLRAGQPEASEPSPSRVRAGTGHACGWLLMPFRRPACIGSRQTRSSGYPLQTGSHDGCNVLKLRKYQRVSLPVIGSYSTLLVTIEPNFRKNKASSFSFQ